MGSTREALIQPPRNRRQGARAGLLLEPGETLIGRIRTLTQRQAFDLQSILSAENAETYENRHQRGFILQLIGADAESHSQTLGRAKGVLWRRGGRTGGPQGSGTLGDQTPGTAHKINWLGLMGVCRDLGVCRGLTYVFCMYVMTELLSVLVGIKQWKHGVGEPVPGSVACLWGPFPHIGLLHPALIWRYVPALIVAWYAVFD